MEAAGNGLPLVAHGRPLAVAIVPGPGSELCLTLHVLGGVSPEDNNLLATARGC